MALMIKVEGPRWFANPFLADPTAGSSGVTKDWLQSNIDYLLHKITERKIYADELEGGPYTSIGGISYALLRVAKHQPQDEASATILAAKKLLEYQISDARTVSGGRYSRYLTGTLGLEVISAIIGHLTGDQKAINYYGDCYRQLLKLVLQPGYQKIGDDEILNGRAGFLAAELEIREWTGQNVASDSELRSVLDAMLDSGRTYSHRNKSPAKLMYQWHEKEYLGAAHGVSGIYQILVSFWPLLDKKAQADVVQSIEWFCSLQTPEGNFPSSGGWIGQSKGDDELVHWCHGVTGVIQLLVAANAALGDPKYLKAAERGGELIWRKGLLRKGPGICHGVAGSGYAFLALYRATGNGQWLERAKCFARFMMDPQFEKTARTPDSPFSLFEGWARALCFLVDLLHPEKAQFPMVPVKFNHAPPY